MPAPISSPPTGSPEWCALMQKRATQRMAGFDKSWLPELRRLAHRFDTGLVQDAIFMTKSEDPLVVEAWLEKHHGQIVRS